MIPQNDLGEMINAVIPSEGGCSPEAIGAGTRSSILC
jgi:hypothetical protein